MSTGVVTAFHSKVQQENRLKSRKLSKQSGLRQPTKQTENRGSSKKYTSAPAATPRRALSEISGNVTTTPWQSDAKWQGHSAVGLPPAFTKRQTVVTSTSTKATKVEKTSKPSSENFPDIESLPNPLSTSVEPPLVSPFYFKELEFALKQTTYLPPTLQGLPEPPVLSLSVPRRPLDVHQEVITLRNDDIPENEGPLLDLPEMPNFDF